MMITHQSTARILTMFSVSLITFQSVAQTISGNAASDRIQTRSNDEIRGQTSEMRASAPSGVDRAIATELLLGNYEEIALAEFVQDRLSSDHAKQFAAHMIRDHQPVVAQLSHLAAPDIIPAPTMTDRANQSPSAIQGLSTERATSQGRGAQNSSSRTTSSPAASSPGTTIPAADSAALTQIAQYQRRVTERCMVLTQQDLAKHGGLDFDIAYLNRQAFAHVNMLAKLQASEQIASDQLRPLIAQAIPMVQHHLTMAKEMKTSLESAKMAAASRTGGQ
jgi:predicted outer membrane protein